MPVYRRGKDVVAFTQVDVADYGDLMQFVWGLDGHRYVQRSTKVAPGKYRSVSLARYLLGLEHGDRRESEHKDRNPLNNRRSNLRIVTHAQNLQNKGAQKTHKGRAPTSRYRGVCWNAGRGKWQAYAQLSKQSIYLGLFDSELEAAEAATRYRRDNFSYALMI